MATINRHDAKTQLSDLVARAEAGEEIVIARRNKPAVRLVPLSISGDATPAGRKRAPEIAVGRGDSTPYDRGFGKDWDGTIQQAGFGESE